MLHCNIEEGNSSGPGGLPHRAAGGLAPVAGAGPPFAFLFAGPGLRRGRTEGLQVMQVSSLSNNSWLQQLQQDLLGLGTAGGQALPVGGQQTTGDASQTAAPPPPPINGGSLLSSFMLSNLFGASQTAAAGGTASSTASAASTTGTDPTTSMTGAGANTLQSSLLSPNLLNSLFGVQQSPDQTLASQIVATGDTNGDGQLSLAEVTSMLTQADGSAPNATSLQAAFNQIDGNGDGEISQSELATALQSMQQSGQAGGAHHHHHHHHGGGMQTASNDSTTSSPSTTSTSSSSSGSGSTGSSTGDSGQTSDDSINAAPTAPTS
jgi:hypothetical protein